MRPGLPQTPTQSPSLEEFRALQLEIAKLTAAIAPALALAAAPAAGGPAPAVVPQCVDQSSHNIDARVDNSTTVNNTVNINLWGKEDTSHLKARLGQLLDELPAGVSGKSVIARVTRLIYGDPSYPQNMTAYIPNKRDNIPHVRTEKGWEPRPEEDVYPAMVGRACDELQQKQDHELGFTPEGLAQLNVRSQHVRAAFDAELESKVIKEAAAFMRPLLQANKHHMHSSE